MISIILNYLFVAFAFVLPISTAGVSIIAGLILVFWLAERDFARKFEQIKSSPVALSVLAFLVLHLVGFAWLDVEPIDSTKFSLLLLAPIVMTSIKKEFILKIFISYIAAMVLVEAAVYYKIFIYRDQLGNIDPGEFMIFVSHIIYNPLLAFAIVFAISIVVFFRMSNATRIILILLVVSMIINMFLTGGRGGQVGFLVAMSILIIYYFRNKVVYLIGSFLIFIGLLFSVYYLSPVLNQRVNQAIDNVKNIESKPGTSVGIRIVWAKTSWELFKEKPFFGHGSGSFRHGYARKNAEISPYVRNAHHPHNYYLVIMVQYGLLGLLLLLSIFAAQIYSAIKSKDDYMKPIRYTLPIVFMVICLSDTYLWAHHTQALFAFFSGILYSNKEV